MPFEIRKVGSQWCVYTQDTDHKHGCHDTRAEAVQQLRALYVHVPEARAARGKSMPDDSGTWVAFGGAVKALGGGRVTARLVRYTSPEDVDLDGEFFDAATDFDRDFPTKVGLYYHHGMNKHLGKSRLGRVEVKEDDAGLFFEHELDLSDAYQRRIYQLAEEGRLGASSGATAHVVEKSAVGRATHLDRWPLGEASFTVAPADRRASVMALKSFADAVPD